MPSMVRVAVQRPRGAVLGSTTSWVTTPRPARLKGIFRNSTPEGRLMISTPFRSVTVLASRSRTMATRCTVSPGR